MEVFVYKGEYGLPSIDLDCLRVLAYIKLADIGKVKIRTDRSAFFSKNGFLPYLITETHETYSGYDRIISFFKREGYKIDESDKNEACLNYIRQNLYPFFMYQLWGNPQNLDLSRALYAARIPFPFNFYYPSKYFDKTEEICQAVCNFSLQDPIDQHDTAEMALKAKKCINWISEKLSSNEFFFNGQPSEADASIYAYLAILIKFNLPNHALQSHAEPCENLTRFVNNFTKKYFNDFEVFESPKAKEEKKKKEQKVFTGQEDEDPPEVIRNRYIASGLFAAISMAAYGYYTGIFYIALAEKLKQHQAYDHFEHIGIEDEE